MEMLRVVFLTVLVFFLIVSIHEWGHYYFAKRAGILVREFAIGFGPKLFSIKCKETRLTLRLLPVGGFVRMAGEDPEVVDVLPGQIIALRLFNNEVTRIYLDKLDECSRVICGEVKSIDLERKLSVVLDVEGEMLRYRVNKQAIIILGGKDTQIAPLDRQFGSKTILQRSLTIFAGPLMNFVLAFALFAIHIQMSGIPVDKPTQIYVSQLVGKNVPAAKAGLKEGDIIQSIDGTVIGGDTEKLFNLIGNSAGKLMHWIILREGKTIEIQVTPEYDKVSKSGKAGFYPGYSTRNANFSETFSYAGKSMKNTTVIIFAGLKKLILGQFVLDDLGGPVQTAQVTGEIASQGITKLTLWTAMLSLYLGIFNLLPIPALDGSRLIFLGMEAIRGKTIDPNRESMVHFIGFTMIILLMLVVTYNDILNLIRS